MMLLDTKGKDEDTVSRNNSPITMPSVGTRENRAVALQVRTLLN